jgi:hypothetical protein
MVHFQGGAIYIYQGTMEISNSTFESNQVFSANVGSVSKTESCYECFLPKELSQSFAPIPGGGHGTFRAEQFMFFKAMLRSVTAPFRATLLLAL